MSDLEKIVNFLLDREKNIAGKIYKLPIDSALIEARQHQSITSLVEFTFHCDFLHNGENNLRVKERIDILYKGIDTAINKISSFARENSTDPDPGLLSDPWNDPNTLIELLGQLTETRSIVPENFVHFQLLLWVILFYNRFIIPYCDFLLPSVDARIVLQTTNLFYMCGIAEKGIEDAVAEKDRLKRSSRGGVKKRADMKQRVVETFYRDPALTNDMKRHKLAKNLFEKFPGSSITTIKRFLKEEKIPK